MHTFMLFKFFHHNVDVMVSELTLQNGTKRIGIVQSENHHLMEIQLVLVVISLNNGSHSVKQLLLACLAIYSQNRDTNNIDMEGNNII